MKYVTATISFLVALIGIAVVVSLALVTIFPPDNDSVIVIGFGTGWRNILGALLGIWAGVCAWKGSLLKARERDERKHSGRSISNVPST